MQLISIFYFHFQESAKSVQALAWSPDSRQFASSHTDGMVRIWDIVDKQLPRMEMIHRKQVVALAWHPDNQHLATGDSESENIYLWNAANGKQTGILNGHQSWPIALAWHKNRLISGGMDGRVILWDTDESVKLRELQQEQDYFYTNFYTILWSPDGKKVLGKNTRGDIYFWHTASWKLTVIRGKATLKTGISLTWGADSARFASVDDDGVIHVYSSGKSSRPYAKLHLHPDKMQGGQLRCIAWHPRGHTIASAGGSPNIRLWYRGKPLAPIPAHEKEVTAIAWSPDGKYLATGGSDGGIQIWMYAD